MSELIDHARSRKNILKHLILQLHGGTAPDEVRPQLLRLLGRVPYSEVVEVEQELVAEGLPAEEILSLCDLHSAAMKGVVDTSGAKKVPPGHPAHTFRMENQALLGEISLTEKLFAECGALPKAASAEELVGQLRVRFGRLRDIDKHYRRKENLVFPFLERHGVTAPPKVMWGKDDEVRQLVKNAVEALSASDQITAEEAVALIDLALKPAIEAISEMVFREEEILLPMCLDKLSDAEWYAVHVQSPEIGYCLYDPDIPWKPKDSAQGIEPEPPRGDRVSFPSGSLSQAEISAILNTIPFDMTFVGADDTVRYFTQGRERIFERNRAIIGRQVQMCHPPASVHVVQQIVEDFKAGRQDRAPFWITLHGRFIHIEYFALRDDSGRYLGTLEVSQDLTEKRALSGEQRLLSYGMDKKS